MAAAEHALGAAVAKAVWSTAFFRPEPAEHRSQLNVLIS